MLNGIVVRDPRAVRGLACTRHHPNRQTSPTPTLWVNKGGRPLEVESGGRGVI